ncbi:hypothetical protein QN277_006243 [Acacia crassicarpa]|uniref:Uncharacterized protein n=1 Tax=Acacia crassicarpa TaxID=499986 RepID=A0AAE1JNT5_9FABA|nr:hypothetical protein QN277_006243 [Acacia crassicarpa]
MVWCKTSNGAMLRSASGDNRELASPEKEDRYCMTRGSAVAANETGKVTRDGINGEERAHVWPNLYISLSSKEEEDFLAMKGCKLP